MRKTFVSAILCAVLCLLPVTQACGHFSALTCDPAWDTATCDVNRVVVIATILEAFPGMPPQYVAGLKAAVEVAQVALAAYEAGHGSDLSAAVAALEKLINAISAYFTGNGQPDPVVAAQLQIQKVGLKALYDSYKAKGVLR